MVTLLETVYRLSLGLAAVCLAGIGAIVLAQVGGRPIGVGVPSANEISGYLVLASTFLALGPALRSGTHIRVHLVLDRCPVRVRRVFEGVVLVLAAALTFYATWWTIDLVLDSIEYQSVSAGHVAIPLALPQSAMVIGLITLAVALLHSLTEMLRGGTPPCYRTPDTAEN